MHHHYHITKKHVISKNENLENFKKENLENFKKENLEDDILEKGKKIENDDNVDYKELFLKAMEKNDELVSKIVEMAYEYR